MQLAGVHRQPNQINQCPVQVMSIDKLKLKIKLIKFRGNHGMEKPQKKPYGEIWVFQKSTDSLELETY